ncbi:MAG: hypothetical protein KKB13_25345 [Chloroflexi bacterium]|nr:hypothetical protein [Chloroflexota bacterium]
MNSGDIERVVGVLLVFGMGVSLYAYYRLRTRHGRLPDLRPLPLKALRQAIKRAAEAGTAIHVSPGVGSLGEPGGSTAETLAGLVALEGVAREANAVGARVVVTTASPIVLPVAQAALEQSYIAAGYPEEYRPTDVHYIAGNTPVGRAAYAAGVVDIMYQEKASANVMVGHFSDEYLLMGEVGARQGMTQLAGCNDPAVLAFMVMSADDTLIGEDMYALGAYMSQDPVHIASLRVQDWARILVIGVMILLVIARVLLGL